MAESDASWIQRTADGLEEALALQDQSRPIVCASGISPSGPIHLGNLREVITTHFVVEELKARGHSALHLHSWDDYDRFRRVPVGLGVDLADYVGMPLSSVPDPCDHHDSYAGHFIAEFSAALDRLGIRMLEVRQSIHYQSGKYNAAIRRAMDQRGVIFDILAEYQTQELHTRPLDQRRSEYYPFRPYCQTCGRDETEIIGYDGETVQYHCHRSHRSTMSIADGTTISGKLAWKVDWPMRWKYEQVVFEPGGEDHSGPGSSFDVASRLVVDVFSGTKPHYISYAFVGLSGQTSKMSGSAGGAAVPSTALDILEPALLRWLYARRAPSQSFAIDLSPQAVQRLYDEWDRFLDRADRADAAAADRHLRDMCLRTSAGVVANSPLRVSFRLLSSAADITQANREQISRIVGQHLTDEMPPPAARPILPRLEPRLTCAINWATRLLPPEERTALRSDFNQQEWERLDTLTRRAIRSMTERFDASWSLEGLTTLVYGVPKTLLGLPEDAPPSPDLKKAQRAFFSTLYRLLCSKDTGPRLPTLLLSIGPERARHLLIGDADPVVHRGEDGASTAR